jgi:hypothetical protein
MSTTEYALRNSPMSLTDRERARLKNVLDTVMRADDAVMAVADERSLRGRSAEDEDLDALHEALSQALERLERLLGG